MAGYDERWTRTTIWYDEAGDVRQVAAARIDPLTHDVLSEAVEPVGPFDSPDQALKLAVAAATALADGHYRGQQHLELS